MQDVNLRCEPGSLTMVVGAVGSGKSSLLAAALQQIPMQAGIVQVGLLHRAARVACVCMRLQCW